MLNFNQLLADYLRLYGEVVRANGQEIEYRGIQYQLYQLSEIVQKEDIDSLLSEYDDLRNWAEELNVV